MPDGLYRASTMGLDKGHTAMRYRPSDLIPLQGLSPAVDVENVCAAQHAADLNHAGRRGTGARAAAYDGKALITA